MEPVEPINALELFPPLSRELLIVAARCFQPTDWARPTICSPWSVKDVAAHLLGGNLGRLWYRNETSTLCIPVRNYDELVNLINHENELWVQAAQRISPEMLVEFLSGLTLCFIITSEIFAQNETARKSP